MSSIKSFITGQWQVLGSGSSALSANGAIYALAVDSSAHILAAVSF